MIPVTMQARAIIAGVFVAVIALIVGNTYRLSAAVDRAELKAEKCGAANDLLTKSIEEQNTRIQELKESAEDAQKRVATALDEVAKAERSREVVRARLAAFQRNAGEGECDAARRIIREYKK